MYQVINFSDFCDASINHDRQEQYSHDGKRALSDYLENSGYGELDVIALCSEFTEYYNMIDAAKTYRDDITTEDEARSYLEDNTTVIDVQGGSIVLANF